MALIRHEVVVTRGTVLCLSFGILLAVACGDSVPGMDAADCLAQPREFVSCGGCLRGYDAPSCTYHPSNPEACYCMPTAILLTGWEDVFECQVPEGICGT